MDRFDTCDRCGHPLEPRNCKEVCPRCGARLDCSDVPTVHRPIDAHTERGHDESRLQGA